MKLFIRRGETMEILTLGSKIKNKRRELGLTLKDLAGERVTPAQLSYVETDKCKPSLDLLEYIAEKLGLEMDYLLESEKKQVSRFCDYNIKLVKIDILKQNYDDAINKIEQVKHASIAYGLELFIGESEKCMGEICVGKKDYVGANSHSINALHSFSKLNNSKKIAETYTLLGCISYNIKHHSLSMAYFKQAEVFIDKLEDIEIVAKLEIYFYLIKIYKSIGDKDALLRYAEKLSNYLDYVNDISKFGDKFLFAGKKLEQMKKYNEALEYATKSLFIYEGIYNMKLISKVETELGSILSFSSSEDALNHLYKGLEIGRVSGDDRISLTYIEIAQTYIDKKDYDNALRSINDALNISLNAGNRYNESLAYYKLFKAFNQKGDYIKAEESIRRCADILETIDKPLEMAACYLEMGQFYKGINRDKEAIEYILKSVDMYQKSTETSKVF